MGWNKFSASQQIMLGWKTVCWKIRDISKIIDTQGVCFRTETKSHYHSSNARDISQVFCQQQEITKTSKNFMQVTIDHGKRDYHGLTAQNKQN